MPPPPGLCVVTFISPLLDETPSPRSLLGPRSFSDVCPQVDRRAQKDFPGTAVCPLLSEEDDIQKQCIWGGVACTPLQSLSSKRTWYMTSRIENPHTSVK